MSGHNNPEQSFFIPDDVFADLLRRCSSDDSLEKEAARQELRGLLESVAASLVGSGLAEETAPSAEEKFSKPLRARFRSSGRPRQPRLLPVEERLKSADEVNQGLGLFDIFLEAYRCLECPNPLCQFGKKQDQEVLGGCPVGVRVPEMIAALLFGDIKKAHALLMEDNPLHRITARVCPQETQCQLTCLMQKKGVVAIGLIERAVGDLYEKIFQNPPLEKIVPLPTERDFPIAIIGSGPAGLTAAIFLARLGYQKIYIFEAFHKPAGVLQYGIPPFRLPRELLEDIIAYVKKLGVKIVNDVAVGRTLTLEDLRYWGFKSFFLGTGAGLPVFMKIKGEELNGVISANEFLTRVNLMKSGEEGADTPISVGRKTIVIGGGNVAMDAARWARRLAVAKYGANDSEVILVYRRTREDMPARQEEILHAEEEGIKFIFLASPTEFLTADKKGWLGRVKCQRMRSEGKQNDGRNRIVPLAGEEGIFVIEEVDYAIQALGTQPNTLLSDQNPSLLQEAGKIKVRCASSGQTSLEGIFVGGDASRGGATVIHAMGDGKKAAFGMDAYLKTLPENAPAKFTNEAMLKIEDWFTIRSIRSLGQGQTPAGKVYAIREMVVYAPLVATRAQAGQFCMVMPHEKGERIPLTLADWDPVAGTIVLVFLEVGRSTYLFGQMKAGEKLFSVLGPLGKPSHVEKLSSTQTVICVGGGVGIAAVYPIAKAHQSLGNRIVSVIGARNKDLMFWEKEMSAVSEECWQTFDSDGKLVTHALSEILHNSEKRLAIHHIVAVGPSVMMENVYKTVAALCQENQWPEIPVVVSLNPTMMDGTGMCGGCRIMVNGVNRYACVDGPEFDAALINFDALRERQAMYRNHEQQSLQSLSFPA